MKTLLPSTIINLKTAALVFIFVFFVSTTGWAASISSKVITSNWNDTNTWDGGIIPGVGDDVTIVNGAVITLDVNTASSLNSLTILSGGVFITGGNFQVQATNINVFGTYTSGSTGAITASLLDVNSGGIFNRTVNTPLPVSTINFIAGGTYVHAFDGGAIPASTWAATSTCEITGVATTPPGGFAQVFGNVVFNSPGQATDISFDPIAVGGNLQITNTGGNRVLLSAATTLSGNLAVSSGIFDANGNSVTFNGAGTQTLNAGGSSFSNVFHTGTGTLQLIANPLTTSGTFTNSNGIFDANGLAHTVIGLATISAGTYAASSGTQTFNGGLTISGGTFTGSTGTVTTTDLTLSSGTLTVPSGAFNVSGNWSKPGGTFTPGANTVTFTGSGTQTLNSGGASFNNISHTGAGTLQLLTNALTTTGTFINASGTFDASGLAHTITGLTTVSGGTYLASSATQTFTGGLTISGGTFTGSTGAVNTSDLTLSSGTFTAPSGAFSISGNWSRTGATFNPGLNTVTFTGNATQSLNSGGAPFNNVFHVGAGTLQLSTNVLTTAGTFTNSNGTFDANGLSHAVAGLSLVNGGNYLASTATQNFTGGLTISGGTFTGSTGAVATTDLTLTNGTLIAPSSLSLTGNWAKTGGIFTAGSGTVTFNGANQTLSAGGSSFNNISHAGSGTLQLVTNALVTAGTFTNSSGVFDTNTHALAHTVTGLATISGGTYLASSATQNFNGGLTISGGTFTGSTGVVNTTDLTLNTGTLIAPTGTFNVSGNWSQTGGTFTPGVNTVFFTKSSGIQTLNGGGTPFNNISHTGVGTLRLITNPLTTAGTFTNTAGTFDTNTNSLAHTVTGIATISGGTYLASSASQTFNSGLIISGGDFSGSTGNVTVVGNIAIGNASSLSIGGNFSVSGTTTVGSGISGSLTFGSTTGIKNFDGLVTLATGSTWDNSVGANVTFRGGITKAAASSFTGGSGTYTFDTNSQALAGSFVIPSTSLLVNGISLTNNNSLSIASLAGTGNLSQSNNASLTIAGAATIASINAVNAGNTVIFSGASQTVKAGSYQNLTINQFSGNATLGGNITVNDLLTLAAGKIVTGASVITLGSSASTIVGASQTQFIDGNLEWSLPSGNSARVFEIGRGSVYAPVTLTTSASGTVAVLASVNSGASSNENIPTTNASGIDMTNRVDHYWTLLKSGPGSFTSDVTFDFSKTSNGGTTANYKIRKYDPSTNWTSVTSGAPSVNTIIGTGITSFSEFEIGEPNPPPSISIQPSPLAVCQGASATFTLVASGVPPVNYQWRKGGVNINGATSSSLTISPVTLSNAGSYDCVVSNVNGSVTSTAVALTVNPSPTLSAVLQTAAVCDGNAAAITLTGLLPSATLDINYLINVTPYTATGVISNSSGIAIFYTPTLTSANNGQPLQITGITVTSSTPNCTQVFTQSTALIVNSLPVDKTISSTTSVVCSGTGTNVIVQNSQSGVNYQLRNNAGNGLIGASVAGTGLDINLPTGSLTATTVFNVLATNATTGCVFQLTPTPSIMVDQLPTVSAAGVDQTICGTGATLAGNSPAVGIGSWTVVSGLGGSFALSSNPTTTFTGSAGTTYVLRWTISNGVCAPSSDDVQIRLDQNPTVSVPAGDQTVCGTSTVLNGTAAVTGTGLWSFAPSNVGAGGSFSDVNSRTSLFTGTAGQSYVLRWTISNGTCAPSSSDVTINFDQSPTVSAAGVDQNICGTGATLAGNSPAVGSGLWTVVSGLGGSFALSSNPTTTFTGSAGTTYLLRWTISNGVCAPSSDDVQIRLDQNPTVSVPAGDQTVCGTSTVLNGTAAVTGTGLWSFAPSNVGAGGSFSDVNSRTSLFTGTAGQSYVLRWTISNGTCTPSSSDVTVNFDQSPTVSAAGVDQTICGTGATLAGNSPAVGSGLWTVVSGLGGSFALSSNPTTTFTGSAGTTYVLRWTISNGVCAPSSDDVQIRLDQNPTVSVPAGDQTVCGTSTVLNGTAAVTGTGLWSFAPSNVGAGGSFSDVNSRTSLFTGTAGQSYVLRWTISNGTCAPSSSDVTVNFDQSPTVSAAGGDQNFCGTTVTLSGNNPIVVGSGVWSFAPGGNPDGLPLTAFSNTALYNSTFTGTAGVTYVLRWTISNGVCTPSSDDVQIRLDQAPTVSVPAGDQTVCGTSTVLNGTAAVTGTGLWSFAPSNVGAGGSFSDVNSRTSLFTGTAGQSYVLRWTISNGTCTPSSSDVTVNFDQSPTVSAAGVDQTICGTGATLAGNSPAVGSGLWTVVSGLGGSFALSSNPTTTFTGSAGTTYVLRWTISNGVCAPSSDDVQIRLDQNPTVSVPAGDQTVCGTSTVLNGTAAVTGTGLWSFAPSNVGAGGSFSDVNSRTSLFTGTAGQSYVLRWTISNGTCTPSSSDVTVNFDQSPTVSAAGVDQTICGTGATLAGNSPAVGIGSWTVVSGLGGSFALSSNPTTTFTGSAGTTYLLRWTISNGVCAPSSDDVQIRLDQNPTVSVPAGDQTVCGTSTVLNGTAAVPGTGLWSFAPSNVGAGGSFSDVNSRTSLFTGTAGQSYVLRWTISNGTCTPSSSDVTVNFDQSPTVSAAGVDQTICGTGATLAGNSPAVGSGLWTVVSGLGGSFALSSNPTTTFTGSAGTTYVLRWTISNGVCAPSSDDVQIRLDQNPTVSVPAGDQTVCGTSTVLNGTAAVTGTGLWSFAPSNVGAGGSFSDVNSRTSLFTGTAGQSYVLRWTISNGTCAPSSSDVTVNFDQSPTVSAAGVDQTICGTGATLAGNSPAVGIGSWTVVSGLGGSFALSSNPTTTFTGSAGTTYLLRWTISNGVCAPSSDDVQIRLDQNPTVSVPAGDQTVCGTSTVLNGTAAVTGTGLWSFAPSNVGAGGSFSDVNSRTSLFTGTAGQSYVLRWTISNGTCAPSSSDVTVNFDQSPTVSAAGGDQNFCGTTVTLSGNNPIVVGSGVWSFAPGGNPDGLPLTAFSNTALYNSTFTGTAGVTYVLRWTISNGVCTPSSDDVQIRLDQAPTVSVPAGDQTVCGTSTVLNGTAAVTGTGLWSFAPSNVGAGGSFSDVNSRTSLFTGTAGQSYVLRWTISNGTCAPSSSDVTVNFDQSPTVSAAGVDQNICGTGATLAGNSPAVGIGSWTVVSGLGGSFALSSNPTTTFTGSAGTTYLLRWTISNGVCTPSSDDVQIRLDQLPIGITNTNTACSDAILGAGVILSTSGSSVSAASYTMNSITFGTGSLTASAGTPVTGAGKSAAELVDDAWTNQTGSNVDVIYNITPISSAGCFGAPFTVTVTIQPEPVTTLNAIISPVCSDLPTGYTLGVSGAANYNITTNSNGLAQSGGSVSTGTGKLATELADDQWTNLTTAAISVIYTITPVSSFGCLVDSFTVTIPISPEPVGIAQSYSQCSGTALGVGVTITTLGSSASASGFNISTNSIGLTQIGGSVSAGMNKLDTELQDDIWSNTGNTPVNVVYTIDPVASTTACLGNPFTVTVTIQPTPSFSLLNNAPSICSGANTNISLSSTVAGAQIRIKNVTYPVGVSGGLSGGNLFTPGQSINEVLINTTDILKSVVYELESIVGSCGPSASQLATVVVNPTPSFSIANTTATICSGTPTDITLNTPTQNGIITLTGINYNGAGGGAQVLNQTYTNGAKILDVLTNPGNAPITVTYTFNVAANGCSNLAPQSTIVVVNPNPGFNFTNAAATICSGSNTNITLNSTVVGAQIRLKTVTYGAVTGTLANGAIYTDGQKITEPLVNNTNSPITVTYDFESIVGACGPTAIQTASIVVNPNPSFTISNPSSASVCSGVSPSISVSSPTSGAVILLQSVNYGLLIGGAYTSGNNFGTGGSLAEGNLVNNTNAPIVVTYTFSVSTPTAPSCPLVVTNQSTTVTVAPAPAFTVTNATASICSGSQADITLNTTVMGAQIRLNAINYNGVTGTLTAGALYTNGQRIVENLFNPSNAPIVVTYDFEAIVGSCGPGAIQSTTITVNPIPTFSINNTTSGGICSGSPTNILLTSPTAGASVRISALNYNGAGGSYIVGSSFASGNSITEILNNSGNTPITATYTFDVIANGCLNPTTQSTSVPVNPVPIFGISNSTPQICSGSGTNIVVTSPTTAAVMTLASVNYSTVTGGSYAGVGPYTFTSGQSISDLLINTGNSPVTITYSFTVAASGCSNITPQTTTVTVNPNPSFTISNANASTALCSGGQTNISFLSSTSGHQINVVNVNYGFVTGGSVTSSNTYVSGNSVLETLLNNTNNPVDVVYTFNVTTPSTTPNCPLSVANQTATVRVLPAPSFSLSNSTASLCSGSAVNISLSTAVTGASLRLKSVSYGLVTGSLSAGATISGITEPLSNTTDNQIPVTYEVEAIVASCAPSSPQSTTVMVNPNPTFSITNSAPIICSGTPTALVFNSNTAGHRINVTGINYGSVTGGTVTGLSTFTNSNTLTETLTNTTNSPVDVVYTFNVTTPLTLPSCPLVPSSQNVTVRVLPAPTFTFSNSATSICSGSQTNFRLSTPVAGGQVRLVSVNYGLASGTLSAPFVYPDGQNITETITNLTAIPVTVDYVFEAIVGGGPVCSPSAQQTVSVVVNPNPTFSITNPPVSSTICSGAAADITLNTPTSGGVISLVSVNYNGLSTPTPLVGGVNTFTNGQKITDVLTNPGNTPLTVIYTFSVSANGCNNVTTQSTSVLVNPTPVFNISNSAPTICSGTLTSILLTSPTANASITLAPVDYTGVSGGTLPSGGTYTTGQSIIEGLTAIGNNPVTITYSFTVAANGCSNATPQTTTVVVNPIPTFSISNATSAICSGAPADITLNTPTAGGVVRLVSVNYNGLSSSSALLGGETFLNGQKITEMLTNLGNTPLSVNYTFSVSANGCNNVITQPTSILVNPTPIFSIANAATSLCSGSTTNIILNSPTSGAVITLTALNYTGTTGGLRVVGNTFTTGQQILDNLVNAGNLPVTVSYTFTVAASGCTNPTPQTTSVVINPNPTFAVTNNAGTICSGATTDLLFNSSTSGHQINVVNVNYGAVSGGTLVVGTTLFTNGDRLQETLVNNTTNPISVVYTFNVSTPSTTPQCPLTPNNQSYTVIVRPEPTFSVTNTTATSICSGSQTNIQLSTSVSGAAVRLKSVTYGAVSGNLSAGALLTSITETLTNATDNPITVTYVFEAIIVPFGTCVPSASQSTTVVVNPNPTFTIANNLPVICSGTPTDLVFSSSTTGHQINVASVNYGSVTGGMLTPGLSTFFNGNSLTETLTNPTTNPIDVFYTFNVTTPGTSPSCPLSPTILNRTVRVLPNPLFTYSNSLATICSGAQTNIRLNTPVAGGQIRLTAVSYAFGSITGTILPASLPVSYNDGQGITEILTNNTNVPQTASYVFEGVVTTPSTAGACAPTAPQTVTVITNPNPIFTITNASGTICSGAAADITLNTPTSGGVVKLESINYNGLLSSSTLVGGETFTDGQKITETLTNTGNTPLTVSYVFSVSANGCDNLVFRSTSILVNPTPVFTITNSEVSVCSGTPTNITLDSPTTLGVMTLSPVTYSGLTGGAYGLGSSTAVRTFTSGQTIRETLINPTNSPITITYSFTISANGCSDLIPQTETVTVNPNPTFTISNNAPTICSGTLTDLVFASATTGHQINVVNVAYGAVTSSAPLLAGATFFNGNLLNDALTNNTNNAIDVVYTFNVTTPSTTPNCPLTPISQSVTVRVLPAPTFTFTNSATSICSGSQTSIKLNSPVSGASVRIKAINRGAASGTLIVGASFNDNQSLIESLINTTASPITVTYELEAIVGACIPSAPQTVSVIVNPNPSFSITNNAASICSGAATSILFNSPTLGHQINVVSVNYGLVTGGTVTLSSTFTDANVLNETLVNTTNNAIDVVYTFNVTTPSTSPVCPLVAPTITTTVRVAPAPTFNFTNSASTICSGSQANILLTSSVSGAQIRLKAINYGAASGTLAVGALFNDGQRINEFLSNTTNAPVTVTYTLEAIVGICGPSVPQTASVIVNPNPSFTVANNAIDICSGTQTDLLFSSNTVGHQINVVSASYGLVTGGTVVAGTTVFTDGVSLRETLSNTTNNPIDVVYIFNVTTPGTAPSCPLVPSNISISVRVQPTPSFTLSNAQPTLCTGTQTNITLNSSVTGAQIRLQSVNYGAASGTSSAGALFTNNQRLNENLLNPTNAPVTVTYIFESIVGSCGPSASQTTTVEVNPNPIFTIANTTPTICSGDATSITLTSPTTGGVMKLENVSYGSVTGGVQTAGTTYASGGIISEVLSNAGNTPVTVSYTFSITANNCTNIATQTTTVTVNPLPIFNIINSNTVLCSGSITNISLITPTTNGVVTLSGVSYNGATGGNQLVGNTFTTTQQIQESLVNSGNAPLTVTYSFFVSAAGCNNVTPKTTSVIVNPNPTFTVANNASTICSGTQTDLQFSSATVGHQINVVSVSYGLVSGGTVAAGSTIFNNGSLLRETLTNTTNGDIDVMYTFNVTTPTTAPACPLAPINQTFTVRVLPTPTFSFSNTIAPSICSGSATDITLNSLVSGVQIRLRSIDYGLASGTLTPGSVFNNGQKLTEILTNTTNSPITVSYVFEAVIGSCIPSATQTATVIVKPIPLFSITNTAAQVCEGSPTDITLNSPTTNAVVQLTAINYNGVIGTLGTGGQNFTDGQKITETLVNPTNASLTVTYTFAATATSCVNPVSQQTTVSITRAPTVVLPSDFFVCEPTSIALSGTIGNSATSGLWSVVSGVGTLSATNVSGSTVSSAYSPSPFDIASSVSFRLTTNDPDGTGPCVAVSRNINVIINRSAKVTAGPDLSVCANIPSMMIQGVITYAPNGVLWSGGSGGSFNSKTIPTPNYSFLASEVNSIQTLVITALDPDGTGPCTAEASQMNLRINPLPLVSFTGLPAGAPPQVAENNAAFTLSGNQQGGVFTIAPVTSNIGSTTPSPTDRATFTPSAVTLGYNYVTYTYADANTCSNSDTQVIVVNPTTPADFNVFGITPNANGEIDICADQGDVRLVGIPLISTGGMPETRFSGPGGLVTINGNGDYVIKTDNVPSGSYQIRYDFKNSFNAVTFKVRTINILASPIAQIGSANGYCINAPVQLNDLSTVNPTPFPTAISAWDWDFDERNAKSTLKNPSYKYPSVANSNFGDKNIELTVTTDQGCSNTTTKVIKVGPEPIADFSWSAICKGDVTTFEDQSGFSAVSVGYSTINSWNWDFGDGKTSAVNAPSNTYTNPATYTTTLTIGTNHACTKSIQKQVFILPKEDVTSTKAYLENFESSAGGWVAAAFDLNNNVIPIASSNTSWIWNVPSGKTIKPISAGSKSWWTGNFATGESSYRKSESSVVNGPCFDLSSLKRPMVSFDYNIDAQSGVDGAVLQYSSDGINWENIGSYDKNQAIGINWFNGSGITSKPGRQDVGQYGWTDNTSKEWKNGRFSLDAIPVAKRKSLRIRVAFSSDFDNPQDPNKPNDTFEGFAFDNVFIGEKKRSVLLEHFTNYNVNSSLADDKAINDLFDSQLSALGGATNFNSLQYHINWPSADTLNFANPADPAARASYFGITQNAIVLDGGEGTDKKFQALSSAAQLNIDNRSLIDPQFDLSLSATQGSSPYFVKFNLGIKANVNTNNPLLVYVALLENDIKAGSLVLRNVFRKQLLGGDGKTLTKTWTKGESFNVDNDGNEVPLVGCTIKNPKNLSIIAFVQDKNLKEIYQSIIIPAPDLRSPPITGLEDPATVDVDIFPNPANGSFKFRLPSQVDGNEYTWKVFDQRGVEMLAGDLRDLNNQVKEVNVETLANGIYHIVISGPNKFRSYKKLVVLNGN